MRVSPKWVFFGIVAFGLPVALTVGWLLGTPPPARSTAGAPSGAGGLGSAPQSDLATSEPGTAAGYASHAGRPPAPVQSGAPASAAPPVSAAPTAVATSPPGPTGVLSPPSPPPTLDLPPVPTPTEVLVPPASPSATPSDSASPAPSAGDQAELARTQ